MSKGKNTSTAQIPREPTRKQLSRAEREAKQRRTVTLIVGGVLAVAALVVIFGFLEENVFKLNEPVANVNGELISTSAFQNQVRLTRAQLQLQLQRAQAIGDQQTVTSLQNQLADATGLGSQVLNSMVDGVLLKQGAKDFKVSVSPQDVQTYIEESLNYFRNPPTPAPTPTLLPTPTASGPVTQTATPTITPFPTPTPVTQAGFQKLYQGQLSTLQGLGISEQDYRQIIETQLIGQKVRAAIAATVPTTTEQIKFQYIRVDTSDVPTVTAAISKSSFATVYQSIISNTFPLTTVAASETTDWVPPDPISQTTELGPAITNALFATPISQTMSMIANQSGTASYTAFVEDKGVQPLAASYLQSRQQKAADDWLQQRRNPAFFLTWADRVPTKP